MPQFFIRKNQESDVLVSFQYPQNFKIRLPLKPCENNQSLCFRRCKILFAGYFMSPHTLEKDIFEPGAFPPLRGTEPQNSN